MWRREANYVHYPPVSAHLLRREAFSVHYPPVRGVPTPQRSTLRALPTSYKPYPGRSWYLWENFFLVIFSIFLVISKTHEKWSKIIKMRNSWFLDFLVSIFSRWFPAIVVPPKMTPIFSFKIRNIAPYASLWGYGSVSSFIPSLWKSKSKGFSSAIFIFDSKIRSSVKL